MWLDRLGRILAGGETLWQRRGGPGLLLYHKPSRIREGNCCAAPPGFILASGGRESRNHPEVLRIGEEAQGDRPMSTVREFGARGDGKSDDTAAILHALERGDGALVFPRGDYLITRPLVIPLDRLGRLGVTGQGGTARL